MRFKIVITQREEVEERKPLVIVFIITSLFFLLFITSLITSTSFPYLVLQFLQSYIDLNTLRYFGTLTILGLALSISYHAKIWNIGAEGQLVVGAIGATFIALYTSLGTIPILGILVGTILGALFGALWSLIPGLAKTYIGLNETLSTLLLNYIAYYVVDYLVYGPWRGSYVHGYPETDLIPSTCWLPHFPGYSFSIPVVFLAIVLIPLTHVLLYRTRLGIAIRAYGSSPRVVEISGFSSRKIVLTVFILSGALAGLAGALEIFAVQRKLVPGAKIGAGLGYTAIVIAWLANLSPKYIPLAAYFLSGLLVFRYVVQIGAQGIGDSFAWIFIGLALLITMISRALTMYKIRIVRV